MQYDSMIVDAALSKKRREEMVGPRPNASAPSKGDRLRVLKCSLPFGSRAVTSSDDESEWLFPLVL